MAAMLAHCPHCGVCLSLLVNVCMYLRAHHGECMYVCVVSVCDVSVCVCTYMCTSVSTLP